jgi:hypothetical protein
MHHSCVLISKPAVLVEQPAGIQYEKLEDGRRLCSECQESAVMDTKGCQSLFREILKFYKHLGMPITQEIPMLLVERSALNSALYVEKDVSLALTVCAVKLEPDTCDVVLRCVMFSPQS